MSDRDTITLPREVVQDALDALTGADDFSLGGTPIYMQEITALRKALAAEQPKQEAKQEPVAYFDLQKQVFFWAKPTQIDVPMTIALEPLPLYTAPPATHPGYIIGSHWLETAYSRICAGEAEADVLRDIGLVRITNGTVETADIHAIVDCQEALRRDAFRKGFYAGFAATGEGWNGEYPFQDKNKPIVGDPSVEAAIDAAMKEDKT